MTAVLVDTDVISFVFKGDTRSELYRRHLEKKSLYVSFMTVSELELWALTANWGSERKTHLQEYLHRFTVIPSTRTLCERWAQVKFGRQKAGRRIDDADAWIAATALAYNIPLVTHNRADFHDIQGLTIISES